jgi:hypothetical protein
MTGFHTAWVTSGKNRREYMFSGLPQVADIVRSAFEYLANPPQLRVARSGVEQFHARIPANSCATRASVVTVGIAPTQTRRPTHAHRHYW